VSARPRRGRNVILLVDDDEQDRALAREALAESRLSGELHTAKDGAEALDYLRRLGKFSDPAAAPRPAIILLDLNMPRMHGFEVLREIKADPSLRRIPVVVLTTSQAEEDIARSYELGVSSFITKPVDFEALVEAMRSLGRYWFETVELPEDGE
jgi:CheY-like chemotaxis protein